MNIMKNLKQTTVVLTLLSALSGVAAAAESISTTTTAAATAKVNINSADTNAIAGKVKGIGQKRADAIVAYRTEHGAFKSLEELANVKGIGENFVKSHMDALNQAFSVS